METTLPELYVDDTNLVFFESLNNIGRLKQKIQNEFTKVYTWVESNSLSLNSSKTKFMIIASKNRISNFSDVSIVINNVIIGTCNSIKCLGLTIDNTLSWDCHINMVKRCYSNLNSLCKIKNYISFESRILVGQALIISIINYMSTIWCTTSVSNLKSIENVIRSVARFTTDKRKFDSIALISAIRYVGYFH